MAETPPPEHAIITSLRNKKKVRVEFIQENFAALHRQKARAVTDHINGLIQRVTRRCMITLAFQTQWSIGVTFKSPLMVGKNPCYGLYYPILDTEDQIPFHTIHLDPALMAKECKTPEELRARCAETLAHEWGHARLSLTGKRPRTGPLSPLGALLIIAGLAAFTLTASMTAVFLSLFLLHSTALASLLLFGAIGAYILCWTFFLLVVTFNEEGIVRRYARREVRGSDREKWLAVFRVYEIADYQI